MAFVSNVTSIQKATEISSEIPAALRRLAFSSLFAQKKFDKLRMTYSGFVPDNRLWRDVLNAPHYVFNLYNNICHQ